MEPARIVLGDAGDARAAAAAETLNAEGLAKAVVIEDAAAFHSDAVLAAAAGLAKPVDVDDPIVVGCLMVKAGEADGCVAGASRPTPDVIRAGLRVFGVAPAPSPELGAIVSSSFFFVLPSGQTISYGDCGVVPDPDAPQLATIAAATADTFGQLSGDQPRVAMLSFSTKGSAEHDRVAKVREATALVKTHHRNLPCDGELQFDAAWVPEIGESKAPGSAVAGRANVFIFPDLDSGNIAYKITERLGGAMAFGPLLQGLNGVLHDLSRGCSADDIVNTAVIASLQSA